MKMEPSQFEKVALNVSTKNDCSPQDPGLAWRGVAIQAPKRITFSASEGSALVPLCGFYRVDAIADTTAGFLLVAKNSREDKLRSGKIVSKDPSPEEPDPDAKPLDPKLLKGVATAAYFNVNLAEFVKLPAESAIYDLHVEFAGLKSNVVRVELVAQ